MKYEFIILSFLIVFSCGKTTDSSKLDREKSISEIKQMFDNYHQDIARDGLTSEFKYLDSTSDFFWVPPGYNSALKYDSVKAILTQNSKALQKAQFDWEVLEIFPQTSALASYTGIVTGNTIDTSGLESNFRIIESGTLIKREDGWKLLNGQSAILPSPPKE